MTSERPLGLAALMSPAMVAWGGLAVVLALDRGMEGGVELHAPAVALGLACVSALGAVGVWMTGASVAAKVASCAVNLTFPLVLGCLVVVANAVMDF